MRRVRSRLIVAAAVAAVLIGPAAGSEARLDQLAGEGIFRKVWTTDTLSRRASDGLGPLFNATACAGCHGPDRAVQAPRRGLAFVCPRTGPPATRSMATFFRAAVPPECRLKGI